jgi:hypothetical protein
MKYLLAVGTHTRHKSGGTLTVHVRPRLVEATEGEFKGVGVEPITDVFSVDVPVPTVSAKKSKSETKE